MTDRRVLVAGLVAIVLGAVAIVAAALVGHDASSGSPAPRAVPVVDRGSLDGSSTTRSTPSTVHLGTVPAGSRLRIPRLHVAAPIGQVTAPGGVMQIPLDPRRVAWWRDGVAPGSSRGSAVVVGHINYDGVSGALAALPSLRPGDAVQVDEPHAVLRYRVQAVRTYAKSSGLPADAFRRTGPARLVLITCGGPFDPSSGNYEDNIVVYALPV